MDLISVYHQNLPEILNDVKAQGINIKIQNTFGRWSDHFYSIEDIRQFNHKQVSLIALILYHDVGKNSTVIDIKSIENIELQRDYSYDGKNFRKIKVLKNNSPLRRSMGSPGFQG